MRYSSAPRCSVCEQRAILDDVAADHLVSEARGLLVPFECPGGNGLHVRNPDFERGGGTA